MARREIDPSLFGVYLAKYNAAERSERGEVLREMMTVFGLSRSMLFERIKRVRSGESVFHSVSQSHIWSMTPGRKAQWDQRQKIAQLVSTVKMMGHGGKANYCLSTEMAREVLIKDALLLAEHGISPDELPSPATLDRWLDKFRLNFKSYQQESAARHLEAEYAGHVFLCDATPLNKYYMSFSEEVIPRPDLIIRDKHLDDILERERLYKIWVYLAVDMYSHTYYLRAFAPKPIGEKSKNGGENEVDWISTLWDVFLPKAKTPLEGIPEFIYSDKGSGLTSGGLKNFQLRLGIEPKVHMPGHSRAKGGVEGRISGFKRSYETLLNLLRDRSSIKSLSQLNSILQGWCYADCEKKGYNDKFLASAMTHPLRRVTEQNLVDATTRCYERKVNAYGCVNVVFKSGQKSQELFVDRNMCGQKVNVFRNISGDVMAQDIRTGQVYRCDPSGARRSIFGSFHIENENANWSKSVEEHMREACLKDAIKLRSAISIKTIMPDETNVRRFRANGADIETESIIAPKKFDCVEDVKLYVAQVTGISWSAISAEINEAVEAAAKVFTDGIPDQFAYELIKNFQNNKIITEAL